MSEIKPIETVYAGCRFRSRLEARWAVFFDTLGIRWEYEPQGFLVDGRPYLPDFLLPDLQALAEVKGTEETLDLDLLARLNAASRDHVFTLILGPIPNPDQDMLRPPVHTALYPAWDVRDSKGAFQIAQDFFELIRRLELDPEDQAKVDRMVGLHNHGHITIMQSAIFLDSDDRGGTICPIGPVLPGWRKGELLEPKGMWGILPRKKVTAAYKAARSARFEHGESG